MHTPAGEEKIYRWRPGLCIIPDLIRGKNWFYFFPFRPVQEYLFFISASCITWKCDFSRLHSPTWASSPICERAKTTLDIERKHASLIMGLPYRYATTRILGLTSILREKRSSFLQNNFSIPSVKSGNGKFILIGFLAKIKSQKKI